jgi:hypothetical protein
MTIEQVRQQISDDFAALNDRHKAEKVALQATHAALWQTYNSTKAQDGVTKVLAHNAAVANAARSRAASTNDERQRTAMERLLKKIRMRCTLDAQSIDDAIEELETRITGSHAHAAGSTRVQKAITRMRQGIIELGGTPRPDPVTADVNVAPANDLSDDEMTRLLDGDK